ncbi:MAG: hypothetical protein PHR77_02570 [Kiritimatiellae bacterium]|nr:hypothetical protein [Kiritimatiellia bacterium]MDD5523363.1 hypothetical protein [Kiritimatiellia bacterium]
MNFPQNLGVFLPLMVIISFSSGCATVPYHYSKSAQRPPSLALREGEEQVEKGRPCLPVDLLGNVIAIPSKIILWHWKVDRHNISTNTISVLNQYLADNELNCVKVRLNEYAPGGEWSRLFRNKSVGAGWRYTIGLFSTLGYTIFPGRLFGGDNFNPYTDTISIYSDLPAITVHEAGHAKDCAQRTYRGTYATIRLIPLVSLYQESLATGDAIGYTKDKQQTGTEKEAYKILYPAFATYIGGELSRFSEGPGFLYTLGAVIPGHIIGRIKASRVKDHPQVITNCVDQVQENAAGSSSTNIPASVTVPAATNKLTQ